MDKKNRENQIKEQRGLWKASSYISKITKRLIKKHLPIEVRYIKDAHGILLSETNEKDMAGKYRRDNPSLERIDGTKLKIPHWKEVPSQMAVLDEDLRTKTRGLKPPIKRKDYAKLIELSTRLSHRLACIHPFVNGNGRASRILINCILLRADLYEIVVCEDKNRYLRAMLQADKGDFMLLNSLIIEGLTKVEEKILKKQKSLLIQEDGKQKRLILHESNFK